MLIISPALIILIYKIKIIYENNRYINKYGEKIGKDKHFNHHNSSIKNNTGKICVNNGKINKMISKDEGYVL